MEKYATIPIYIPLYQRLYISKVSYGMPLYQCIYHYIKDCIYLRSPIDTVHAL